jgi:hypothetical protein
MAERRSTPRLVVVLDHRKDTERKCHYTARRPASKAPTSDLYLLMEAAARLEGGPHPDTITIFIYGGAHARPPE